eukprot:1038296-Rhodomonas_salina.1
MAPSPERQALAAWRRGGGFLCVLCAATLSPSLAFVNTLPGLARHPGMHFGLPVHPRDHGRD